MNGNADIGSLGGFGGTVTDLGTTARTSTLRIAQTTATNFSARSPTARFARSR